MIPGAKSVGIGGLCERMKHRWLMLISLVLAAASIGGAPHLAQGPGSAWSDPVDIAQGASAGRDMFGVLVCDNHQNLHVLWGKGSKHGSEIFYRNDRGGEWSQPLDVIATSRREAIRLSVALAEPQQILHVIWQNAWVGGDLLYSRAPLSQAENPRAWEAPQLILPGTRGELETDPEGNVYILYAERGVLNYIRSDDNGTSWGGPVTVYSVPLGSGTEVAGSLAFDEAGRMHVAVTLGSRDDAYVEAGYLQSSDGGVTWQTYLRVLEGGRADPSTMDDGSTIVNLSIYSFGDDELHLTWHDPRRMHMWSSDGGQTWSEPTEIVPLSAGFGGDNELAMDSAGRIHAVVASGAGVFSATWMGSGWGLHQRIEYRNMDPHAQSVVACRGNELHVVYDDRHGEETTVWYASRSLPGPAEERRALPSPSLGRSHEPVPSASAQGTLMASDGAEPSLSPSVKAGLDDRLPPSFPLLLAVPAALMIVVGAFIISRS